MENISFRDASRSGGNSLPPARSPGCFPAPLFSPRRRGKGACREGRGRGGRGRAEGGARRAAGSAHGVSGWPETDTH